MLYVPPGGNNTKRTVVVGGGGAPLCGTRRQLSKEARGFPPQSGDAVFTRVRSRLPGAVWLALLFCLALCGARSPASADGYYANLWVEIPTVDCNGYAISSSTSPGAIATVYVNEATWSSNSFTATYQASDNYNDNEESLSGTLSADHDTLTSLVHSLHGKHIYPCRNFWELECSDEAWTSLSLANVPFDSSRASGIDDFIAHGAPARTMVTSFSARQLSVYYDGISSLYTIDCTYTLDPSRPEEFDIWVSLEVPPTETPTPAPSTISQHTDQAGGPPDNHGTKYDPEQLPCQGLPHYSVNTSLLNLVIEDTDFGCQSYGHDEALRRVWNMLPSSGMFGNGWSFAYESSLVAKPYTSGGATLTLGSGQTAAYSVASSSGTGTVTVNYTRDTAGRGPTLTGVIDAATGAGYYTLTDKETKLTQRYDYVGDASGDHLYRLSSITDSNGNAISLSYNGNGRIATLTDASNRQTVFTYDSNNRCTGISTFDGRSASYQYDTAGNLTQSVDLAGNVIAYAYDGNNYPTAMTVAGKTTSFTYATDSHGNLYLSAVTEPNGTVWRYAFGSNGTTQVTEPGGGVRAYGNSNGRTTAVTDPLNHTATTVYNALYLPTSITDPQGNTTSLAYDNDGNLATAIDPAGNTTTYTYDANWNLTSITDALGHKTSYLYDTRDNLIAKTTPLGLTTLYLVDDRGRVMWIIPPDGSASYGFGYDDHGNLTSITDPLGNATHFAFDAQGLNLSGVTDALGHTTAYSYDANRRLTGVVRPDQTSIQYGYDPFSLMSILDAGGNTTRLQRDPVQQITSVTDPLGNVTQFAYNDDGDMISTTDPLGRAATVGYDAAHRPTSSINPLNSTVDFGRDANGNLTSLTDERGKTTAMTYDSLGALADVRDPLNKNTTITRDALGRISSVANARGGIVSFLYDADGRLTGKKYDNSSVATYAWSLNGYLTSVSDAFGTRSFTRDAAGRVTAIAYPDGHTVATTYDAVGNVLSLTYSDGLTVTYTYDALNRVTGVSFGGNSLSLAYGAAGRLTGETRSNGVQSAYSYNANRQLTRVTHQKGTSAVADITYTRNAAGLITQESGTWPLSAAPTAVDTATASYDDANGVVHWNSDSYTYDADGNLTTIGGSRTLAILYDPENRPTSITLNGVATQYAYDGLGNRVQGRTTTLTRNFYHDTNGRLLFDIDVTNSATNHYIYAGDRLVASGSSSTGYVFYHFDKTGNTLALTDAGGSVVAAFAYDPYGRVVARSGSVSTPFTYVGAYGVIERAGDLFFMKHRYYDAVTGRFIQRDPIGFAGGYNLYRYVDGNPVIGIDPEGTVAPAIAYALYVAGFALLTKTITEFTYMVDNEKSAQALEQANEEAYASASANLKRVEEKWDKQKNCDPWYWVTPEYKQEIQKARYFSDRTSARRFGKEMTVVTAAQVDTILFSLKEGLKQLLGLGAEEGLHIPSGITDLITEAFDG